MNAWNLHTSTMSGCEATHADLVAQRAPTPLRLAPIGGKPVELDCEGGRWSAEAGRLLLKDSEEQRGLTRALATALSDARAARRSRFPPED